MRRYPIYILFAILVILGLAAIFFVRQGYYPLLIVNGHWLSEDYFEKNYQAAWVYYQNLLDASAQNPLIASGINKNLQPEEIKAAVMNGLIENILINDEAFKELGLDLKKMIDDKISQSLPSSSIQQASQKIYGLNFNDFQEIILKPQAERDILSAKFFADGRNFDEWLKQAKKSAKVKILLKGFFWNGSSITVSSMQ